MNAETINIVELAIQRVLEKHPRPTAVTQKQAAEMLNVSTGTVSNMVKFGRIKRNQCGLIPISEVDRLLSVS